MVYGAKECFVTRIFKWIVAQIVHSSSYKIATYIKKPHLPLPTPPSTSPLTNALPPSRRYQSPTPFKALK